MVMEPESWEDVRDAIACPYCPAKRGENCVGVMAEPWLSNVHFERRGALELKRREDFAALQSATYRDAA